MSVELDNVTFTKVEAHEIKDGDILVFKTNAILPDRIAKRIREEALQMFAQANIKPRKIVILDCGLDFEVWRNSNA